MIWYFTYGQSGTQPFYGGWTEVTADTRAKAIELFREVHEDTSSGYINCAGIYSEKEFRQTKMPTEGNFDYRCIETIRRWKGVAEREYTLSYLCLRFREYMDFTQAHLAKVCNIDRTTLWKIEKGGKVTKRIEKNVRKIVERVLDF